MMEPHNKAPRPVELSPVATDIDAGHLCPFCGTINPGFDREQPCRHCLAADSNFTRSSIRSRMGPWYVLQSRNPAAPGVNYATLIGLIRRGQVKPRSIVRGPTSGQMWMFASSIRGLSREFGVCFDCGKAIDKSQHRCPFCKLNQEPPINPDVFVEPAESAHSVEKSPAGKTSGEEKNSREPKEVAPESPSISLKSDTLSAKAFATAFDLEYVPHKQPWISRRMVAIIFKVLAVVFALSVAAGAVAYFNVPQWAKWVDHVLNMVHKQ